MSGDRYVISQAPASKAWRHYLCAWIRDGRWVRDGICDRYDVPVWLRERDQALAFDEATARQLVDRLDGRYRCPASGLHHDIEKLLEDAA